jgi:hypothetical protein
LRGEDTPCFQGGPTLFVVCFAVGVVRHAACQVLMYRPLARPHVERR